MERITQGAPPTHLLHAPATKKRSPWLAAVLILFAVGLYSATLFHLVEQWWHDPNFSHGFVVAAFSLIVGWQGRERLTRLGPEPSWKGLLLIALSLLMFAIGSLENETFLARLSLLPMIAGLIAFLWGWNYFRALLFPWIFLILMIPLPDGLFHQITYPLQLLAAKVAAVLLPVLGVPVFRNGSVIYLPSMSLEVAEACSGIRSVFALLTVAVGYGYLMEHRLWARVVLAFASVPIAILANSLRIVGTGLLVQYWDTTKAAGFFHEFAGGLTFVASLAMLVLLDLFLRRTVVPSGTHRE